MINAKELYEFMRDKDIMCETISDCEKCKLRISNCTINKSSTEKELETIINAVNEWKNKSQHTRKSEFLKLYPNARVESGYIDICPRTIDNNTKNRCDLYGNCYICQKEYWNEIVEQGDHKSNG